MARAAKARPRRPAGRARRLAGLSGAGRPARRAKSRPKAGKRAVRPARRRAGLHLVPKRRKPEPRPPFAGALAHATTKQQLLFEMVRARVTVHAAVQGLQAANADQPTAPGKWSVREHVLHLCHRDREVTRALESALRGIRPAWAGMGSAETDRFNAQGLEGLRHHSWEEAQRLLLSARLQLMEELESVAEEPLEVWSSDHPFGAMLHDLAGNDRHHADLIKRWRAERGV